MNRLWTSEKAPKGQTKDGGHKEHEQKGIPRGKGQQPMVGEHSEGQSAENAGAAGAGGPPGDHFAEKSGFFPD